MKKQNMEIETTNYLLVIKGKKNKIMSKPRNHQDLKAIRSMRNN